MKGKINDINNIILEIVDLTLKLNTFYIKNSYRTLKIFLLQQYDEAVSSPW